MHVTTAGIMWPRNQSAGAEILPPLTATRLQEALFNFSVPEFHLSQMGIIMASILEDTMAIKMLGEFLALKNS
jgi:hypothetical protein